MQRQGTVTVADVATLISKARDGSVRSTARLLSYAENGGEAAAAVAAELTGVARHAQIIGITGAPGAGKSTLTGAMIGEFRRPANGSAPRTVAILAVDPSSPFSGGALLGDRVRMVDHVMDSGVFIRSMSTRGHLGGLAAATPAAVDLMSALGYDIVIIETVGVGQSEIDVMNLADTVVVVLAPGMGDGVQAAKAGILEIADILVVNKADHEGADATVRDLRSMVALGASSSDETQWRIPIQRTTAYTGDGVGELVVATAHHRAHLIDIGELSQREAIRAVAAIESVVIERFRRVLAAPTGRDQISDAASHVVAGRTDHHRAADDVIRWLQRDGLGSDH